MAHFALLWKARTIEKYRLNYENEKYKSILAGNTPIPQQSLSQRWRHYRYNTKKRISMTFRRLYPEGSSLYNFFLYFQADQSCLNIVLKSLLGFSIGIGLTYLSFLFFIFQLSISLLHATIMSSIIGVLLTMGLAFSYRIRCLIFLLIPQFFSRAGRYTLTCYALVLILTGPATNTLKNSEVLSESMACQQEQLKTLVNEISHSTKKPYNLMKESMKIMVERLRLFASGMKETVLKVNRLILSILQVIQSAFSWLNSLSDICNKNIGTPYERCKRAVEDGIKNCEKKFGPKSQRICNATDKVQAACLKFKRYKVICVFVDLIKGSIVATIKKLLFIGGPEMREDLSILLSLFERYLVPSKGLKNFSRRIRSMLYLQIHISHSYTFSGNTSHSPGQVAAGIVTEIRKRADPILTWLSWSSCVTSLFLLLIIFRAKYYQHMYDTRSRFDNRYITKEMRDLDLKRLRQGRETVLPLNRRERSKYITTTSFRLVTSEKIYLNRSAVFMAITTFKLMIHMAADYSLYWVLTTIRHHGSMQTPLPFGPPNAGMQMSGSGRIAELFRWLLEALTTPLEIPLPSHTACLPDPHPPDLQRYGQIGVLIFLLWFFALFEPYGLRLRHVIMGRYRPERAKARAEWLYNHILRTRGGFMKFARRKLHKSFKYTTEEKYTFKAFLRNHIPFSCLRYLLGLGPEEPRCLLCGTTEYVNDRNTQLQKCDTPRCIGIYCSSCFSDIGQLCTICLQPKDYGDLSDVSLEKGSSDESDDDTDDDIKHGRHSASQVFDHCSEIQVNDVNEQTPFPNPTKERKRSIYHSNVNNGCLEKLPLIDNLHRYTESSALIFTNDLDDKRKENRLAKGFKKEQNYCYNYDQNKQNNKVKSIVITLKDNVTKPISYMEKKNVNAITEIGLNTPKESEYKNGCNISIFVNRITTGFCRMIESRQFMVCPLVTLQNGNKNIILRNGKNDIRRGLLKSGRSGNDCLKEISNKQSDIHSRLKCGTISLNFYDVDVSKKNIVVKKIMHPSVSIRSLGNEKNQAVKKRRHILNFNHHDTNNVNNRYFMTLNDEPFTDNTALKINEYSRCNRNEETNNTKKNKQKNEHDVKEITTQNFENGDNKINVLESKNEKSSCCFQTICYLYRQHMKCNKSTGCNTHSQKTTDIQKNHKSRKKHKSKAKLRKKNKIRNHKKDDEDTRNCRILAYLDEQDWMKRNVHKIENDDSGTVLSTANENGTFDYKENKIANRENIIERDNHQAKAATNLCPNCVVQNCDMKNLYLSKEQSIQLKSNNNTSFDIERRLAFCNQLANPDVDEKHLKYHVETYTTGINLKKTANSGQSDTSSNLKMPREESNENENRCHICGICCSIRKRLQNILDQISKASSRSETCFNNIVEKIVSIIPGDTCGVDCNGDENNIDGKEVPINCEEHICTCKDIDGYDLVKKISSIVRKHIHMRFKENPETANKCENTTTTCKEFSSHELIKKISSHVRKYVKIMYNERTENANKLEKVICNCNKVASPELDKPEREHKCENAPSTSKEFTNYELVKIISSHVRKYMKTMFKEKPHTMHKCENTPSTYQEYANYNLDKKICSHVKKYMKIMKLKEKAKMANKSNVRCEEQNKIAKMQTTSKAITDSGCQCGSYGQDYCNGNFTRDEDNMKMPDKDTAIHRFINCLANKNVSASPEMRTCSCQYCIDDEGSAKKRKQSPPKTLKQQKKVNKTANLGDLPSNSCQCREDAQESKSLARIFKNIYKRLFNKKIESEIDEKKSKRKTKKENKGKLKKKKNKEKQNEKDGKKAKKFPVPPPESCHCQHEVLDQRTEDCNKKEICKTKECRQTIKQATPWQTNKAVKKEKQKVPTDEKRNGVESSYSPSCSCRHFAKRKDNTQAILKETKEKAVKKRKAVLSKTVAFQSFRPTAINNKETTAAPLMYSCSCHKCLDSKLIQNKVTQTSKSMGVNAGTQDAPSCLSCACGSSTFPPKKCTCASQYNAWDIPGNNDDSACLILPQKDITLDGLMALQLNLAQDEREKKHSKASTSNSTSSTPNTSSLISEVSVTDTTICNMTYIDDYKKINKTPRMTVVTKSNRGTEMEKINVCDVSTLTSDWWSPMLEKKNVKDKDHLEKKRGDHRIHKNIGRKDRIVSTDGKYVSFKSKAQLIPDIPVDILSPARYLLESQKYYNELFLSKCHAPTVYPVNRSQIKRRQENRSSIGSHSRRNHRIKRREDISTLRKQI